MGNSRVHKRPMIRPTRLNSFLLAMATGLSLLLVLSSRAWAQEFATGKVIEKVTARKDDKQSYALYLPSGYAPAKPFPIIYAFDPGARGLLPVERFKEAAEKYGYIIVGSNNSRNGPGVRLSEILNTLLDDTQSRLAIDGKRVYATGFSGGARVAGSLALSLKGQMAGVIACGAGFPGEAKPAKDLPFAFYGIAGSEDFNLIEVRQLVRTLDSLGATTHLAVFEGEHSWPPAAFCTEAVEWLELQAIKSGRRNRDDKLIAELFAKQVERLRADESANKTFDVFLQAAALAKDFQGLGNVGEFAAKAEQLKSSKEVKDGFKQEKNEEQLQQSYLRNLFTLRDRLRTDENPSAVTVELRTLIANLRKKSESDVPGSERSVARRTLGGAWVSLMEESAQLRYSKQYAELAATLALASEIRPSNAQVLYNLARAQALLGKKKEAVESLKKAVEKGFANLEELKTNPDLETIRGEKAYKQLIETLSKKTMSTGGSNAH